MGIPKLFVIVSSGQIGKGGKLTTGSFIDITNSATELAKTLGNDLKASVLASNNYPSKVVSDIIHGKIVATTATIDWKFQSVLQNIAASNEAIVMVSSPEMVDIVYCFYYEKILGIREIPPMLEYFISGRRSLIVKDDGSISWIVI